MTNVLLHILKSLPLWGRFGGGLLLLLFVCTIASAEGLPVGYIPASVKDFALKWVVEGGKNNVEITFTAPTEMMNSRDYSKAPLTAPITKIEIMRSAAMDDGFQVIGTLENPTAGEALKWVDKDVAFGTYDYMAQVYVGDAMDWANAEPIVVGELPADLKPGDFTATTDPSDPYCVILEVTLPSTNSLGEPLKMPITKVEFGEMSGMSFLPEVFYTEDAEEVLVPGTKLQYVVDRASNGNHTYSVAVYTAAGSNYPAMSSLFIGKDQPGRVQNIHAKVTDDGIVVTWEVPIEGLNGGDMGNLSAITYTVKRGADQYDESAVVIAKDIKEFSVTDKTTFTEESKFVYIITAKSPYGEGYPTCSNQIVVGPASTLPFSENFDVPLDQWGNTTTKHSTWVKESNGYFCAWQIGQNTYANDKEVKPHSGKGLLYAFYSPWGNLNQWDSFTSGTIDFSAAESPLLTFWLYDWQQGGSPVSLKVQTSTDGTEFATAETINIGNATEDGWHEVTVALPALKNAAKGKIRFLTEAIGTGGVPVAIDDILIEGNATGIKTVRNEAHTMQNYYNLAGQRVSKDAKGLIIKNGKKFIR